MSEYKGLTKDEVNKSREKYGQNVIEKTHKFSPVKLLLSQFTSPLIYVLVAAGVISILFSHVNDAIIVFIAVAVNAFLGFYQEYKAERSLEELEKVITVSVDVVRGGKRKTVKMGELVPGDLVYLKMGDKVPADGVVVEAEHFSVNEAVLTGESVPVEKGVEKGYRSLESNDYEEVEDVKKVFMGTTVTSGLAVLYVVRTGSSTEVGKIASRLQTTVREQTVLQQQLSKFAKILTWIVVGVSMMIFVIGVIRGQSFREIFLLSVAVAVSAIPEGLVIALTAILAVGMRRILKRRGLVRKLLAAEALGSVTVVCADKTGTLTKGEMTVVSSEGDESKLIKSAIYGNDMADPLEVAMMSWGKSKHQFKGKKDGWDREATLPFNPTLKYAASVVKKNTRKQLLVRGAPEVVIEHCKLDKKKKKGWNKKFKDLAGKGYRLVGFAMKDRVKHDEKEKNGLKKIVEDGGLEWLGVLVFEDPVRGDVKNEIEKLKTAGIEFKVITGDYAQTAKYVMEQLGVEVKGMVITGEQFSKMKSREKKKAVREKVLFARFSPEEKLEVVELLQKGEEVVAMMGDGVNDAPALKKADVGVVVSSASEVSKETADMVLLDDNFETIVEAVEEGRGIFANIRKVVLYLLSDSFSEVILVIGSIILGMPLPITAAQILWVNLANDSFPALALTLEPLDDGLMEQEPRSRKLSLIDGEMRALMAIISGFTGVYVLVAFWWLMNNGYTVEDARTVAFLFLGVDSLLYVFVARSLEKPLWKIPLLSNIWLVVGVVVGMLLQLSAIYVPHIQRILNTRSVDKVEWMIVGAGALFLIISIEIVKFLYARKFRREEK